MITSPANEHIKYVRSLQEVKIRRRERAFVIEGVRLVEGALQAGAALGLVLVAPEILERAERGRVLLHRLEAFRPILVSERALEAASDTRTTQGVIAVVGVPPAPERIDPASKLVLVLDGLADPGNVGTILRTAWASGIARSVIGLGCVDFYNSKLVRAGAGAHFHLELIEGADWQPLRAQLVGRRIVAAVARAGKSLYEIDWRQQSALVVGSEAHGVREPIIAAAVELVSIPIAETAESLNAAVAAAILTFEAVRQNLALPII